MKRILSLILVFSFIAGMVSCERKLNIEEEKKITETKEKEQIRKSSQKHKNLDDYYSDKALQKSAVTDAHKVIENADFSHLEKLYAGKPVKYIALHEHSNSGGTSDGKIALADWPSKMEDFGIDFIAIVDHRQMRHFFLPEWDTKKFIYGTEPAAAIKEYKASIHYTMLFKDKYDLKKVLDNFPEFGWSGDEMSGSFKYPSFSKDRFMELAKYVRSLGGAFFHSHPLGDNRAYLNSENPLDYYFGEFTFIDTIYNEGPSGKASKEEYELWEDILKTGVHIYNSANGDQHSFANNGGISTIYSDAATGSALLDTVTSGNFTAGYCGIKMAIGDNAMGSIAHYKAGDILTIEAADLYQKRKDVDPNGNYYLRVFTDQGLCAFQKLDAASETRIAIEVKDRKYYRADVYDAVHDYAIAISNPIWMN